MFYRIKDNRIYDYADYEYAPDCLYSVICTMSEFQNNPEIYTVVSGALDYVENYQDVLIQKSKDEFEREFFETSLGWIRRKVTMKDGSVKDFLADLLLPIKAGMEMGQAVEIITYKTPDFSEKFDNEYMKSLQEVKYATEQFIRECLFQTVKDFSGEESGMEAEGGNNGI